MSLKDMLRHVGQPVMNVVRDGLDKVRVRQARKKLEYWQTHKTSNHKIPRIGFIMQVPTCWDKIQPVFELASSRDDVEAIGIVVPDFQGYDIGVNEEKRHRYGAEYEYFHKLYDNVVDFVNPDNTLLDIRSQEFDYIFYQRPYDILLPKELRAQNVIRFSKTCYIPYGAIGAKVFEELELSCKNFFRNVSYNFVSSPHLADGFSNNKDYKTIIEDGLIECGFYGYPNYEYTANMRIKINRDGYILWTPRWSCDEKIGGSNFFEYRDTILKIKEKYPAEKIVIRPHPLMFKNFIKEGRLSQSEYEEYLKEVRDAGIEFDENSNILDTLRETKLVITDFSTIIPDFFMANIPIIYCHAPNIELNDSYHEMIKTEYVVNNSEELIENVTMLLTKGDDKSDIRRDTINKFTRMHENSSERIIYVLMDDFIS